MEKVGWIWISCCQSNGIIICFPVDMLDNTLGKLVGPIKSDLNSPDVEIRLIYSGLWCPILPSGIVNSLPIPPTIKALSSQECLRESINAVKAFKSNLL